MGIYLFSVGTKIQDYLINIDTSVGVLLTLACGSCCHQHVGDADISVWVLLTSGCGCC